jgi:uncharacterized protein (TIGR02246 family)
VPDDFDEMVDETHRGLNEFVRGNADPMMALFSRRDDATLANPLGPPRRGRKEIEKATQQAAAPFREGTVRYEEISRHVTPELAYLVEIERFQAKVGGSDELSSGALRVTMIFRREDDGWRIVHRHADPITAPRPIESILQPNAQEPPEGAP